MTPAPGGTSDRVAMASLVAAALVLTVVNAAKPLVVDDTAYVELARQIAKAPLDPYGFEIFWHDRPQPASQVLLPPLLSYWIAPAVAAFPHAPWVWKLWLLPFALALVFAAQRLARLLAPGLESLVVWLVVLTPSVLSGFNLMLDVPALALGLLAIWFFIDAVRNDRVSLAVVAGLLAGLAVQTKYTGATALAACALFAVGAGRFRLLGVMATVTTVVFVGWEGFILLRYGESQWVVAMRGPGSGESPGVVATAFGVCVLAGATLPAAGLLARARGGLSPPRLATLAAVLALPFAGLLLVDPAPHSGAYLPSGERFGGAEAFPFALSGLWVLLRLGSTALRGGGSERPEDAMLDRFLLGWLALEFAALLVISHISFFASRRMLLFAAVATLSAARAASRSAPSPAALRGIAAFAAGLACLFGLADLGDALARRQAVLLTAERVQQAAARDEGTTVWFAGHWGFQHYAREQGFRAIVPGESHLAVGDWLVLPRGVSSQGLQIPGRELQGVDRIEVANPWPWSTIPAAYIGSLPVRRQPEYQLVVELFRVRRATVVRPKPASG